MTLGELHLDHEQDLVVTCDMWVQALAALPRTWDDGVDGTLLFHLLFSGARDDPAAKGRRRCASVAARAYPLCVSPARVGWVWTAG